MAQISAAQADAMGIPSIPDISNMTTGGGVASHLLAASICNF